MQFKNLAGLTAIAAFTISCQSGGPQDIKLGSDQCDHCKMTITDAKYAAELVTDKGRVYKFDDLKCMQDYATSNTDKSANAKTYATDFSTGKFIETSTATIIQGGSIKSPMSGNYQVYSDKAAAEKAAAELGANLTK